VNLFHIFFDDFWVTAELSGKIFCVEQLHKYAHKYTWYRPSMKQKSMIDFCIVSAELFSGVLDVRVKRGAEFSTDHHLVVCSLRISKPVLSRKFRKSTATYMIK